MTARTNFILRIRGDHAEEWGEIKGEDPKRSYQYSFKTACDDLKVNAEVFTDAWQKKLEVLPVNEFVQLLKLSGCHLNKKQHRYCIGDKQRFVSSVMGISDDAVAVKGANAIRDNKEGT